MVKGSKIRVRFSARRPVRSMHSTCNPFSLSRLIFLLIDWQIVVFFLSSHHHLCSVLSSSSSGHRDSSSLLHHRNLLFPSGIRRRWPPLLWLLPLPSAVNACYWFPSIRCCLNVDWDRQSSVVVHYQHRRPDRARRSSVSAHASPWLSRLPLAGPWLSHHPCATLSHFTNWLSSGNGWQDLEW
jgi:hypothetical protein